MIEWFAFIQKVCVLFLVGLIWFVQVVHYPLFYVVGSSKPYYLKHQQRVSGVVIPPMVLELVSATALFAFRFSLKDQVGMGLLVVIWLSTFLLQVPCHRHLLSRYSDQTVSRLVKTNWIRTISWSMRAWFVW